MAVKSKVNPPKTPIAASILSLALTNSRRVTSFCSCSCGINIYLLLLQYKFQCKKPKCYLFPAKPRTRTCFFSYRTLYSMANVNVTLAFDQFNTWTWITASFITRIFGKPLFFASALKPECFGVFRFPQHVFLVQSNVKNEETLRKTSKNAKTAS